jgi:hypothetical protein
VFLIGADSVARLLWSGGGCEVSRPPPFFDRNQIGKCEQLHFTNVLPSAVFALSETRLIGGPNVSG